MTDGKSTLKLAKSELRAWRRDKVKSWYKEEYGFKITWQEKDSVLCVHPTSWLLDGQAFSEYARELKYKDHIAFQYFFS